MKTLYFDCSMGAAGDMMTAALLDLMDHPQEMVDRLNALGIPGISYHLSQGKLLGSRMDVLVDGQEEHSHDHEHTHEHNHEHTHEHSHEHSHEHTHEHSHEHTHEHCHEDSHEHTHEHCHEHSHEHTHDHEHTHTHGHSHVHHNLADVKHIVEHLPVEDEVKKDIHAVFSLIAQAEGHVHHKEMDQIHFHEVGTMDAIADVAAVCLLMNEIKPDQVLASPVHVGSGRVRCAHGILPVPAPATAYILRDVPIYGGAIKAELCTPTGAALLKYYVNQFTSLPMIRLMASGYGLGHKEFDMTNCLTAYLGEVD